MSATLEQIVTGFRDSSHQLRVLREAMFPLRCFVKHRGSYCLASVGDGCPPDKVPLIFENGNTWWKPIEECERVSDLKTLPRYARQMKLQFHGYKTLRIYPRRNNAPLP